MEITDKNPFSGMVVQEWTASATIDAWRRWHRKSVQQLTPMTQALIEAVSIKNGDQVLDLASGSGEPALSISSLVGSAGRVVATDLSEDMIELAKEHSTGIQNMEFQQADVHQLPFPDNHFDVVTCRLGVMYFWDCPQAMSEIKRVLRADGRVVFVAWDGLERNRLAQTMMTPFFSRKPPPQPPAGAPHPFRFALPNSLADELTKAGYRQVKECRQIISCPWPGHPEELWQHLYEVAVPLQPYIDALDAEERQAATEEVIAGFKPFYDGTRTDPGTAIVLATGVKMSECLS